MSADHRVRLGEDENMNGDWMSPSEEREYADRIHELRLSARQERAARRHAFWTKVRDVVMSVPAGVGVRIGG